MPHLFLDTERMSNITSGLGQVCLNLGRELVRQRPPDWDITFLVPPEQVGAFGDSVGYVVPHYWHRFWRPWRADVWHCLHQGSKFLPMWSRTRLIYTVLDLNYLSMPNYSARQKAAKKRHYQRCIDRANMVTTISEYVARDVRHQLIVAPDKPVQAIYLGVNTPDGATLQTLTEATPTFRPAGPFLLFIGFLQAYKNVHSMLPLLRAYPEYRLVLAGPDNPAYSRQIREQAQALNVADRVLLPGPVDEATKWWLYAHCEAFLFPSLLEGFGLPVIEAMSFGKPVFSSPLTSLPEVGGDVAFYFPDFTADSVVDTFRRGMDAYRTDATLPDRLRQQSQQFSWVATAQAYWNVYQGL